MAQKGLRAFSLAVARFLGESGKGMFAGVVGNVKEKHFCKGVDCRFSYENIGEKSSVVGYCFFCDRDKVRNVIGIRFCRDCRFSYEYIGEKNSGVGYCIWCDRDIMLKAVEDKCFRNCDRSRFRRRGCLLSRSKGVFSGYVRNVDGCSHAKGCSAIYVCVLDISMELDLMQYQS